MLRSAVVIICWRISAVTGKRRKDVKNAEKTITGTKGRRDIDEEGRERKGEKEKPRAKKEQREKVAKNEME